MTNIYLASVLLEKNRWGSRVPSIRPSQWLPRIAGAGFDGLELWENHVLRQPDELEAIKNAGAVIGVFNTYIVFNDEPAERYREVADAIRALGAPAVKFNFDSQGSISQAREKLLMFAGLLPESCRLLCECHAGTIVQEADVAAQFLSSLPHPRFGAILHGVGEPEKVLARYRALEGRVQHIHAQIKTQDKSSGNLAACVEGLKREGFAGTYSVEFTHTSQKPQEEDVETAFAHACDDLRALRALLG